MNRQHHTSRRPGLMPRQWWAAPVAFLATLLALPVNAGITIPNDPLTTGVRVAPNVLFILDDSGSMASEGMPDAVPALVDSGTPGTVSCNRTSPSAGNNNAACYAHTRNTLSYNPATTYTAWTKADGTLMTGGTSYDAAYGSFNLAGGSTINLGSNVSCDNYNQNNGNGSGSSAGTPFADEPTSGGDEVCGGVQTFLLPRTDVTSPDLSRNASYWRYQILKNGSDIKRGTYGAISSSGVTTVQVDGANTDTGTLNNGTAVDNSLVSVAADQGLQITINNTTSGSGTRNINYWVYDASGYRVCSGTVSRNSSATCVTRTVAGIYKVTVQRASNDSMAYSLSAARYTTNSCDGLRSGSGWINCTSTLPSSRTLDNELINYATWFSYYRTRMKAAKAGTSLAFAGMDSRIRAGFRTIWGRTASRFDIPVTDGNDGRFVNNPAGDGLPATTSRSQWYDKLFGVIGHNGTPLKGALQSAGDYFTTTGTVVSNKDTGPYGPETGVNQYTCRQNFAILTTDGYWNSSVGFNDGNVANEDGSNGVDIGNPTPPGTPYRYSAAAPYNDSSSDTLADVAMYYWKNDLRTEAFMGNTTSPAGNNVPTSDDNPAFWQHMVTFGISIGLSGTVDQTSVAAVRANGGATYNSGANSGWPTPVADTATAIDDLLHAAVNGHGTFIAATDPIAYADGLKAALSAISKRTSSFSNVAANSASLRSGAMVFNASYVSGSWSGDMKGYAITSTGVSPTPTWSANFPAWSSRKIYTNGGLFPQGTQTASLARTGVGAADYEVTGDENVNYIKGKQTLEGSDLGDLRERTSLLGDIVGSSPEFVEYTNTLYVGANDGMLHAFNAANGAELFAYVPGILNMSNLRDISRGDYATQHKFFVDGPVVASSRTLTPGKNILVGALGKGGRGIFALDVSDVSSLASPGNTTSPALWEKTSASVGYGNLGLVLGKPVMGKVSGTPAVVIGNGPNSPNDRAVLIVANLTTGDIIKEIDTGQGGADAPNGLFAPTGILGPDGNLEYVYAGDMLGNLWKFNLTTTDPTKEKTLLFSAKANGGAGAVQPITGGIGVATDPKTRKRWVFFGTGRFLTTSDAADKTANAQGMYGIIDGGEQVAYADLQARSLTGTGTTRTADTKAALTSGKKGWYIPLPGEGERIVQDTQVVSNVLVTASMLPSGTGCDSSGTGYVNAVDAFTGTSTGQSFFDTNGDGVVNASDTVAGSMNYGVGMPTAPMIFPGRLVVGGTGGSSGGGAGAPGGGPNQRSTWSRVSWRETRQD
jgi:type IV pilus assembly protein PilY1